jgi:hypothetical protein
MLEVGCPEQGVLLEGQQPFEKSEILHCVTLPF